MKTILITGVAGFIGYHLAYRLLKSKNNIIVGLDNLNSYYDINLKVSRLKILKKYSNFKFIKLDIKKGPELKKIFQRYEPKYIINLAAQAGVRYSLENPKLYLESNIIGFFNLLDLSRIYKVNHFVYASTSSVYGANKKQPFKESDTADHPIQFYAATKRSNEIMAHSYSCLYNIPTTGLRFFTVYGPWGRPDMALFKFVKNILNKKHINVFNFGNHSRDWTYIDDIVNGILKALYNVPKGTKNKKFFFSRSINPSISNSPFQIYNLGNSNPINLLKYIKIIEKILAKKSKIKFFPLQKGDVISTKASLKKVKDDLGYKPKVSAQTGIKNFINWYKSYYNS